MPFSALLLIAACATPDADTDPTPSEGPNLLANPAFEEGFGDAWLVYPLTRTNFAVLPETPDDPEGPEGPNDPEGPDDTVDTDNASTDTSATEPTPDAGIPYEGARFLRLWGVHNGAPGGAANETPIYQELPVTPGVALILRGYALHPSAAPIGAADTWANLVLKFFDDDFTYLGGAKSETIGFQQGTDVWVKLEATGRPPWGTTLVQAGAEFHQCVGSAGGCDTAGSVSFDALTLAELR